MSAGTTRREALTALALTAAIGAAPTVALAKDVPVNRSVWDQAFARFQRVKAEYDRLCDAETAADEAAGETVPREARFFDEYGLYMGDDREAAVRSITAACWTRDFGGRGIPLYPRHEREAYEAKLAEINAEAERVADEFMTFKARAEEAKRRYRCKELAAQRSAYLPRYQEARDALMVVPAPDNGALLTKLEIATESLDNEHAESALADARRLLSVGRA